MWDWETWFDQSHYNMKSSPTNSEVVCHLIEWSQVFFPWRCRETGILCFSTRQTCFEVRSLILHRIVSLRLNLGKLIIVIFFFVIWGVYCKCCFSITFLFLSFQRTDAWFVHFDMDWYVFSSQQALDSYSYCGSLGSFMFKLSDVFHIFRNLCFLSGIVAYLLVLVFWRTDLKSGNYLKHWNEIPTCSN